MPFRFIHFLQSQFKHLTFLCPGSEVITDELRHCLQEPEESDHRSQCSLLHPDCTERHEVVEAEDGASATGTHSHHKTESGVRGDEMKCDDGWIYVLGHDKLKKKVS